MSDNRKVLVAKRHHQRSTCTNVTQSYRSSQAFDNNKQGTKRPNYSNDTPKKNLANDRLKRLRLSLYEDSPKNGPAKSSPNVTTSNKYNTCAKNYNRKRPQGKHESAVAVKLPKKDSESKASNKSGFVFKEENSKKVNTIFTTKSAPQSSVIETRVRESDDSMEWSTVEDNVPSVSNVFNTPTSHVNTGRENSNKFFIVVDTNVFLSHLQVLKDIVSVKIVGSKKPILFIPWIVIEELDFIKEDSNKTSLRSKAQEAIKYIERNLSERNERILGQTLKEVSEQRDAGKSQDNKIISCCLQVLQKYNNMILLTGDVNLRNKAYFNHIPACSHNDIMAKVLALNQLNNPRISPPSTQTKAQTIMNKMTTLCTTVINECAKSAYGAASNKMPICQSTPKSLQDCISIFIKYWFPVFQEFLMKQFKKAIEDLSIFLTRNKSISDSETINELLKLCVRICIYLKDVQCCKDVIEHTICDLNNIKET